MAPTITPYDFTNITSGTGNSFVNFIQFTSRETSYLPGMVVLIVVTLIIALSLLMRGVSPIKSFTAASFVNMIIAILLYGGGIINSQAFVVSVILPILGIFCVFVFEGGV